MEKNNKLKDKIQGSQNSIYKAIQLVYFRFLDLFCHENIKILLWHIERLYYKVEYLFKIICLHIYYKVYYNVVRLLFYIEDLCVCIFNKMLNWLYLREWSSVDPMYFFFLHTSEVLLIMQLLFFLHADILFFEIHFMLLAGRVFFIIIMLLLHTQYKNYILWFYFRWYGQDKKNKQNIENDPISAWGDIFFIYIVFTYWCYLMLFLQWFLS